MGHSGCVLWFTGLSGCGQEHDCQLCRSLAVQRGVHTCLLDGDNVRHGLNASAAMLLDEHGREFADRFGLGFQPQDRTENIRRIAAVAQLFAASGLITLTAFVSPYRQDRDVARRQIVTRGRADDFIEIYVGCSLAVNNVIPKGFTNKPRGPNPELHRHSRSL